MLSIMPTLGLELGLLINRIMRISINKYLFIILVLNQFEKKNSKITYKKKKIFCPRNMRRKHETLTLYSAILVCSQTFCFIWFSDNLKKKSEITWIKKYKGIYLFSQKTPYKNFTSNTRLVLRDLGLLPDVLLHLVLDLLAPRLDESVVISSVVLELLLVHVDHAVAHAVQEILGTGNKFLQYRFHFFFSNIYILHFFSNICILHFFSSNIYIFFFKDFHFI